MLLFLKWALRALDRDKQGGDPSKEGKTLLKDRIDIRKPKIRCPRCAWEPRSEDRWECSCGFIWNTFDTRGLCPACDHQWEETQCLRCREWSLHEDWYVR